MSEAPQPDDFAAARTRRRMARAAGLSPDHWYAVEWDRAIAPGQVVDIQFWGRPIALFRGRDGVLAAIENRCAHRQIKLSEGEVVGCTLVCPYHGWTYDAGGRLVAIPHDLFGRSLPRVRLQSFPVRVRYGLVWLFPGAAELAEDAPLPEIPELEGPDAWPGIPIDFTWAAHHSMIVENVSDFTHAHLHRRYRPFSDATLRELDIDGLNVRMTYDVLVGDGRFSRHFVDRRKVRVDRMTLGFSYPWQWSDTGGRIRHFCFFLPLDAGRTRVFFIFYFDAVKIPLTPWAMPRWLMRPIFRIARRLLIRPLLAQDGRMVEAEQIAFERAPEVAGIEFNPVVIALQKSIVEGWRRHLEPSPTRPAEKQTA